MSAAFPWQDQTAQQLVRYEALFKLFDGIQSMDDFDQPQQPQHAVFAEIKRKHRRRDQRA